MERNDICLGCMGDRNGNLICPHCGYKVGTAPIMPYYLQPGTMLGGKYLVGRGLGHGGFGVTYLALDTVLNIKLAIKEYFPQDCSTRASGQLSVQPFSGEEQKRQFFYGMDKFLEEARTLAQFDGHPGIVSVRDFFKANGTAYLVMNYLDGMTLKEFLLKHGNSRVSYDKTLEIMLPVMDALETVHSVGVLHRDISPDNIFLTYDGKVQVIDFGAARQPLGVQRSISVILKPGYAPEEQYRSHGRQGPWTDIYAVAATFYRMLTGKVPPESLDRLESDTLVPPSRMGVIIPPHAETVILQAMSVRAQNRFQTMKAFRNALLSEPIPGMPAGIEHPITKTVGADDEATKMVSSVPAAPVSSRRSERAVQPKAQEKDARQDPGTYPLKYTRSKKRSQKGLIIAAIVVLIVLLGVFAMLITINGILSGDGSHTPPSNPTNPSHTVGVPDEMEEQPKETPALIPTPTPTPTPTPSPSPAPLEFEAGTVSFRSVEDYMPGSGMLLTFVDGAAQVELLTGKNAEGSVMQVKYDPDILATMGSVYRFELDALGALKYTPINGGASQTLLPAHCAVGTSFTGVGGDSKIVAVNYTATIVGQKVRDCIVVQVGSEYRFYAPGIGLHTIRGSLQEDITPTYTLISQQGTSTDITLFVDDGDEWDTGASG